MILYFLLQYTPRNRREEIYFNAIRRLPFLGAFPSAIPEIESMFSRLLKWDCQNWIAMDQEESRTRFPNQDGCYSLDARSVVALTVNCARPRLVLVHFCSPDRNRLFL